MGSILDKERERCNYSRDCLTMKILSCHSPTFSGSTLKTNEINWLLCFRLPIHYPLMQNTQLLSTITTTKAGVMMSSSMIWNSLFLSSNSWALCPIEHHSKTHILWNSWIYISPPFFMICSQFWNKFIPAGERFWLQRIKEIGLTQVAA